MGSDENHTPPHLATYVYISDNHYQTHTALSDWPSVSGSLSEPVGCHLSTALPDWLADNFYLFRWVDYSPNQDVSVKCGRDLSMLSAGYCKL